MNDCRQGRPIGWVLVGWMIVGSWGSLSHADGPTVVPLRGPMWEGTLVALSESTATFATADGTTMRLAYDDLVRWGSVAPVTSEEHILLTDHTQLVGTVHELDADRLRFTSDVWGELTIPRSRVAAIIWHPPATSRAAVVFRDKLLAASDSMDRLYLANGDAWSGELRGVRDGVVEWTMPEGSVRTATDRLAAWRGRARAVATPSGHFVGLRDGTEMYLRTVTMQGSLEAELICGLTLKSLPEVQPLAEGLIVSLRPDQPNVHYVSALSPLDYHHRPFLPSSPLRLWRADRNVLGGPLTAGNMQFDKGIGMTSMSQVEFPMTADDGEFQAEIGIDGTCGNAGSVVFRVLTTVDGKEWTTQYQSDVVRGGQPLRAVRLPLPVARRLALAVDYADNADVLDRANWVGARLCPRAAH